MKIMMIFKDDVLRNLMNWSTIKVIFFIPKHFGLIVCLEYQPERKEINYMLCGNGKFSAKFSYCANIHQSKKSIMYNFHE